MKSNLEHELRRMINMTERLSRVENRNSSIRMRADRGQGKVLVLLLKNEHISQKELLYLMDCRPQSLAEILKKLELQGLVIREPSVEDKRVLDIRLTEEGIKTAEEITDSINEFRTPIAMAIEELSDEEQKKLHEYMQRINASLEDTMRDHGFRRRGPGRRGPGPDRRNRRGGRFEGKEIL